MFTGIVETMGRIESVVEADGARTFEILGDTWVGEVSVGDSIAVDGACLTVESTDAPRFTVTAVETTLKRTRAGSYQSGTPVNLERAARIGDRLDGHFVTGHVDALGRCSSVEMRGTERLVRFEIPEDIDHLTLHRGSITINGVSLTVAEGPENGIIGIAVIPHTWEHTNLSVLRPGDLVNVEADLIGKYVGRMLASGRPGAPTAIPRDRS